MPKERAGWVAPGSVGGEIHRAVYFCVLNPAPNKGHDLGGGAQERVDGYFGP